MLSSYRVMTCKLKDGWVIAQHRTRRARLSQCCGRAKKAQSKYDSFHSIHLQFVDPRWPSTPAEKYLVKGASGYARYICKPDTTAKLLIDNRL